MQRSKCVRLLLQWREKACRHPSLIDCLRQPVRLASCTAVAKSPVLSAATSFHGIQIRNLLAPKTGQRSSSVRILALRAAALSTAQNVTLTTSEQSSCKVVAKLSSCVTFASAVSAWLCLPLVATAVCWLNRVEPVAIVQQLATSAKTSCNRV